MDKIKKALLPLIFILLIIVGLTWGKNNDYKMDVDHTRYLGDIFAR